MFRVSPSALGYTFKWLNGKPPEFLAQESTCTNSFGVSVVCIEKESCRRGAGPSEVKDGEIFSGEEFVGKNVFEEHISVALHLCILEFIYKLSCTHSLKLR